MPVLPFCSRASWIWSSEGTHSAPAPEGSSPSHYQVRRFRREFVLGSADERVLRVNVSADSRYLLYFNGALVGRGPAKGDVQHQFFDSYDLSSLLREGVNVIAALVFDMSRVAHRPAFLGAPCSVMTYAGGFLLEGEVSSADGSAGERLDTGLAGWRVAVDKAHRFQNEGTRFEGYLGYFEHRCSKEIPADWLKPLRSSDGWSDATTLYQAELYENRRDPTSPYGLLPRMIPMLEEDRIEKFGDAFLPGASESSGSWNALINGSGPVVVGPGESVEVIFDRGELTTAFPILEIAGGAGSSIRLTYAEALRLPWSTADAKLLGTKQSLANLASHYSDEQTGWTFDRRGVISGWSDVWEPAGNGSVETPEVFEPVHWRAYRYVGLRISSGPAQVKILGFIQRFTAYPFHVAGSFACSDERLNRLWHIGIRTMRLCSHETFEDCPHYEQMQYAGDTMITSRIAMLNTGDYRLTRQALFHFDWSRISEGLTQSRYPSRLVQVIPSWSLHWITAIKDYVFCSGDLDVIRELMPGIEAVLAWFRRHSDADGLPEKLPFWNITDWCPWWPRGVVPGADSGPTAIIAAQYISALSDAADIAATGGLEAVAGSFSREAVALRLAYNRRFWSEADGLYWDRPGGPEVSQYGNAWAIVCGAAGTAERARIMKRFPLDPKLAPGSYFCWHAVFHALDLSGAYERMPEYLAPWHEMSAYGLSTFVEENSYWRSLCHAWSAHPVLEFQSRILGVAPRAPGFAEIEIRPHLCGLSHAKGRVCSPRGMIDVAWSHDAGIFKIDVRAPDCTPVRVLLPDGSLREFNNGAFSETLRLP